MRSDGLLEGMLLGMALLACDAHPEASSAPAPAQAGEPARTGRVIEVSSREPVPPVHPGDVLEWRIADSPLGIAPEHRVEWGPATVSGTAVRKLDQQHRPSTMAGDRDVEVYTFLAVEAGTAVLRSSPSSSGYAIAPIDPAGPRDSVSDEPRDIVIEVVVTAREPE